MKKFSEYTYGDYINDTSIFYVNPMTCKEGEVSDLKSYGEKKWVAQEKFDGHRAIMFLSSNGTRVFSRTDSVKTNWKTENTDKLPHFRDCLDSRITTHRWFDGCVLDGELIAASGKFKDVQSITGSLEEKAIEFQEKNGYARYVVFDIIKYRNNDVRSYPFYQRFKMLVAVVSHLKNVCPGLQISIAPVYCTDSVVDEMNEIIKDCYEVLGYTKFRHGDNPFKELLDDFWTKGKEGLILKDINAPYEHKRSNGCLKFKEHRTYDVVISGFKPPTREYTGKTLKEKGYWNFWEKVEYDGRLTTLMSGELSAKEAEEQGYEPVTKPYCLGWIGAITCGLYKDGELVDIVEVKGITDADQHYIKNNKEKLIGTCIEITAQEVIDKNKKSLRHPRFNRWRTTDKDPLTCTWDSF